MKNVSTNNEMYDLSNAQKRIYISQQLYAGKPVNNIAGYVVFNGMINIEYLITAITMSVRDCDSFSIRLCNSDNHIKQYFSDDKICDIGQIDFKLSSNPDEKFQEYIGEFAQYNFEFWDSPLYKINIFTLDEKRCGYMINFHHIISDGWSTKLFAERVEEYYKNLNDKSLPDLDIVCGKYKDYLEEEAVYLKSDKSQKHKQLWLDQVKKMEWCNVNQLEMNRCEGERISKTVNPQFKAFLLEAAENNGGIPIILSALLNLIVFYSDSKYAPFIGIPNYNRVNNRTKKTIGMFTSTVLAGIAIIDEMTLDEVFNKMKMQMRNTMRYQQYPYNLLYNELKSENPNLGDLFHFSMNYYNTELKTKLGEVSGEYQELYSGYQAIPLQIIYKNWNNDKHQILFDYRKDSFCKQEVENIFMFFNQVLELYSDNKEISVYEIRNKLINRSIESQKKTYPVPNMISSTFSQHLEMIVSSPANAVALYTNESEVSYDTFRNWIMNAIGHLSENKITTGSKVVICLENSAEYIVYAIAAFALRAVVIPLDRKTKLSQLDYIYNNCNADILITRIPTNQIEQYTYLVPNMKKQYEIYENLRTYLNLGEDNIYNAMEPAYVIYTSGTTGEPKGVMIRRESIANYLSWAKEVYCEKSKTFFMFSSTSFDLSITTLLLPFVTGGSVVIDETNRGIHYITRGKYAHLINAIKATPSQLELLLAQKTEQMSLGVIISGGEELTTSLANRLTKRFGKTLKIYNEYGPTEATIGCMCYMYQEDKELGQAVPIGIATPGTTIYIVKDGKVVNGHDIGEMYIEGIQVSSGYTGLDEQTKESFVHLDFSENILYKTGDLAFWNYQNQLEYLGRKERQNKVNGFRVELNSIENVIKNMVDVQNCIVLIDEANEIRKIIAVVQTKVHDKKSIYAHLNNTLPDYCIPHHIFITDNIPLTQNGKVDYSYIDQLKQENRKQSNEITDNLLQFLYQICEEILNSGKPIETYNFIMAGGDSIKALLLNAKLQEYGVALSLADILLHPELSQMVLYANSKEWLRNDVGEEVDQFDLPDNLKLFERTAESFDDYAHVMMFHYDKALEYEQVTNVLRSLKTQFILMNSSLRKGKICKNNTENGHKVAFADYDTADTNVEPKILLMNMLNERFNPEMGLAKLYVVSTRRESYIGIRMHHILADGVTWKYVIDAFCKLLQNKPISYKPYAHYSEFSRMCSYHMEDFQCNIRHGRYTSVNGTLPIGSMTGHELKYRISETLQSTLSESMAFSNSELWLEWDGRGIKKYKQFCNTLGCFSIFLPIKESENISSRVEEYLNGENIELSTENNIVRLNFIGDLKQIVPEEMHILTESIDMSMEKCSAYGCMLEITVYIIDNMINISLSSRSDGVTEDMLNEFMDRIQNQLDTINGSGSEDAECLVDLSESEYALIFG